MSDKTKNIDQILSFCKEAAFDLQFTEAAKWKAAEQNRVLIGYMPIYFPRELVHAMNGLAVGIMGSGDRKQIVKGDAYYQSYICHMPRGLIEMALDGHFDEMDGFLFPSICDVIRNLSGMFQILGKGKFAKYLDYPQDFNRGTGGVFYRNELKIIINHITKINGVTLDNDRLNESIKLQNLNRKMLNEIYDIRQQFPWRLSAVELYHIQRAGIVIPVERHNDMLREVLDYIREDVGTPMDKIKVVVSGSFCEQPPIGLIRSIEQAGCYIVDDDFLIGSRWIEGQIDDQSDDPLTALANAYVDMSTFSSSVYDVNNPKGIRLAALAKKRNADGIIFAAPSFCDPALLDRPILQKDCEERDIRYISIKFSENTGQFKVIKEQVGAFSDSIKLWDEPVTV